MSIIYFVLFFGFLTFVGVVFYLLGRPYIYNAIKRRLLILGTILTGAACLLLAAAALYKKADQVETIITILFFLSSLIAFTSFSVIIAIETFDANVEFVQTMREKQMQRYLDQQKRNNPQN